MGSLECEVQRLLNASMAHSTHTTYERGVLYFDVFRSEIGFNKEWPAPIQHIVAFIAHLSITGKAASSINTYISALSYIHKLNGWPNPSDNFIIKKLREGSRRQDRRLDTRRPITIHMLHKLSQVLQSISSSSYEEYLFRAAILIAFFGFLRVGEFTASSKNAEVNHIIH